MVINTIEQNALSTIVRYTEHIEKSVLNEWPFTNDDIINVRDNLGNVYEANGNGGHGNIQTGTMEWSFSIDQSPAEATTLFVTQPVNTG
ncbi:hypothetical protein A0U40_07160 [[Bacillus] sp. KCTC 13219]|nr:hypothetical protein A0U40_07160 [[Bacillus] sp. KCTC 13219]